MVVVECELTATTTHLCPAENKAMVSMRCAVRYVNVAAEISAVTDV